MTTTETKHNPCLEPDLAPSELQPGTRIKKSKAGRWRAIVLLAVNLAIAAHFIHWKKSGETLTPVEPSEAMAFTKDGIVNAGLIFFVVAIATTLVLGRWFCGWACHVVALQDGALWLLKKLRLRPRQVDLGVLGWIPWLAFVYMFLMPLAYRLVVGLGLAEPRVALMTEDFWATFPNWLTAVLTVLTVGLVMVWFLGAKGFCWYGCPYGGIFGVVDQLAPVRIRVNDACSGCGHCTAVCTSNVKVHQEVRDWKTVVDSACMKCLDCVSVCPKDALSVGFGAPALFAKRRTQEPARDPHARGAWTELLLLTGFFGATMFVFLASNPRQLDVLWPLTGVLTAFCVVAALPFRGRKQRRREYTLGEEIALGLVFLLAMQGIHGRHIVVGVPGSNEIGFPFLFALGLSATIAFLVVQAARMLRKPNVSLQNIALRAGGRARPAGVALHGIALGAIVLLSYSGWSRAIQVRDEHRAIAATRARGEAQKHFDRGVAVAAEERFEAALAEFRAAVELAPDFREARENMAGMFCALGRFDEGLEQYRLALEQNPNDAETHAYMARAHLAQNDLASARRSLESAIAIAPERAEFHAVLAQVCAALGDGAAAAKHEQRARELSMPR